MVLLESPLPALAPRSRARTGGYSEPVAQLRRAQRRPRDSSSDSEHSDWDVDPSPRGRPTTQRRNSYYRDGRSRSPVASPAARWAPSVQPVASPGPAPPVAAAPEDKVMAILRAQYQSNVADALRAAGAKCGDATAFLDQAREKNAIIQDLQAIIARVHKAPDGALPVATLEEVESLAWEVSHGPRGNDMPYAYAAAMRDLADEIDPRAGGSKKMRERLEKNAAAGRKLGHHSSGAGTIGNVGGGGGGGARRETHSGHQPHHTPPRGGRGPTRGPRDDRRPGNQGRDWAGRK